MNQSPILSPFWERTLKEKNLIDFYPTPSDSTHIIVSRFLEEGRETIGHVYVEFEENEFRYVSTNRKGKEIFQPTTDFNLIETQFERYARLLALQQKARENNKQIKILNYNLNQKNTSTMKNQSHNTAQKTQKQNQLRFIEYEKPAGDGHFITIGDSYHNTIGRIHKSFSDETKKYEYVAFDHDGNLLSKSDKLWELKNEFVKNREQFLEQAHQRRISSKEKAKEVPQEKKEQQVKMVDGRKTEMEKLRQDKTGIEKQFEKSEERSNSEIREESNIKVDEEKSQEDEREQELDDLRNDKDDDRGDMGLDR